MEELQVLQRAHWRCKNCLCPLRTESSCIRRLVLESSFYCLAAKLYFAKVTQSLKSTRYASTIYTGVYVEVHQHIHWNMSAYTLAYINVYVQCVYVEHVQHIHSNIQLIC